MEDDDGKSVKRLKSAGIEVDGDLGEAMGDSNILRHLFLVGVLTGQFTAVDVVRVARVNKKWNSILDDTTPTGLWYTIFMALADKYTLYVDPVTEAPLKPAVAVVTKPPLSVDIHSINWSHYTIALTMLRTGDTFGNTLSLVYPGWTGHHTHRVGIYYFPQTRVIRVQNGVRWEPNDDGDPSRRVLRMIEIAASYMKEGYYLGKDPRDLNSLVYVKGEINACAGCGSTETVGTCVCGIVHYCGQRCMESHWASGHDEACAQKRERVY